MSLATIIITVITFIDVLTVSFPQTLKFMPNLLHFYSNDVYAFADIFCVLSPDLPNVEVINAPDTDVPVESLSSETERDEAEAA